MLECKLGYFDKKSNSLGRILCKDAAFYKSVSKFRHANKTPNSYGTFAGRMLPGGSPFNEVRHRY
jgi:hypothetical protein